MDASEHLNRAELTLRLTQIVSDLATDLEYPSKEYPS